MKNKFSRTRECRSTERKWHIHFCFDNKKIVLFPLISLLFLVTIKVNAQTIFEDKNIKFGTSGYLRTGIGRSEGGHTQSHFQMPGAQNKYSLGNQADTYGELEFDYTYYLGADKSKSLEGVWMTSIYEDFGTENKMNYNKTEQLYIRTNNLLGKGESIWVGKLFYDRRAIHMMDRQWINPGQTGWGFGMENLLQKEGDEDIKFGLWTFKNDDVVSYINRDTSALNAYTFDVRWVHVPIRENFNINVSFNYTYRSENKTLVYKGIHGVGAIVWVDYRKNFIDNTTAVIFRQGANIPMHHWTGMSEKENPNNDNIVLNNLNSSYFLEINNNFLYDDMKKIALNGILSCVIRDFGTKPFAYDSESSGNPAYLPGKDKMLYWLTAGARGMYYLCDYFKLSLEYTHEYVRNQQIDVSGHLEKISFTPEFSLKKGFYSRPVLRPFITYAFWTDELKGHIGTTPNGAPFGDKVSGFTYGLQFEIWW